MVEHDEHGGNNNGEAGQTGHTLSRRTVGRLLGSGVVLAGAPIPAAAAAGRSGPPLSRAEFVAMISDHFDWVHSSQYLDPYKLPQPTFTDVTLGRTRFATQIETALEEGVLDGAGGPFHPRRAVTRQDAARWLVRAFVRPSSGPRTPAATDLTQLDREPGVDTLRKAGLLPATDGKGRDNAASSTQLTRAEAQAVLGQLTAVLVSPPQVMCKPGTTAPRRYITISTPTPGARLHYTFTFDGSEPPAPTAASPTFDLRENGVLQFVNPLGSGVDSRFYRLKAVALKDGLAYSAVREFTWNIVRPEVGSFRGTIIRKGTATSPTVWRINNPAEYYQANVYYLEGSQRGLVFDAGEYSYLKENLKTFIDSIATKPYDLALGHAHPDHGEQIFNFTSAGVTLHVSAIERAALLASPRADFREAAAAARVAEDGHTLDLGNVQVSLFHAPGHTNGLMTALVHQTGWVYASDHFACNRPYTADTTQYNLMKVDRFLSLQQQLLASYRSRCGEITEVTNAHQDEAVGLAAVDNFLLCFQRLIDDGDVTEPSIRGGISGNPTGPVRNSRMSKVGDMWRDRNWIAIGNSLGSGWDKPVDFYSAPTGDFPTGVQIDYNAPGGHRRYSVLSNIEFEGGTLVGVDVFWAPPANGVQNKIANKFDPWTFDYTVRLAPGSRFLRVTPTAMSNRVTSLSVNGARVRQGHGRRIRVRPGSVLTVDVVAPDGITSSRYTFSVVS